MRSNDNHAQEQPFFNCLSVDCYLIVSGSDYYRRNEVGARLYFHSRV